MVSRLRCVIWTFGVNPLALSCQKKLSDVSARRLRVWCGFGRAGARE